MSKCTSTAPLNRVNRINIRVAVQIVFDTTICFEKNFWAMVLLILLCLSPSSVAYFSACRQRWRQFLRLLIILQCPYFDASLSLGSKFQIILGYFFMGTVFSSFFTTVRGKRKRHELIHLRSCL